jgi:hypothetical protein
VALRRHASVQIVQSPRIKSGGPFNRFAQFKPLPEVSVKPLAINGA